MRRKKIASRAHARQKGRNMYTHTYTHEWSIFEVMFVQAGSQAKEKKNNR